VPNSLNRFAFSSWMPPNYNPDGSLNLYFQDESPCADKEAIWLPARRKGRSTSPCVSTRQRAKERCADR
jgi:hypothetical protein